MSSKQPLSRDRWLVWPHHDSDLYYAGLRRQRNAATKGELLCNSISSSIALKLKSLPTLGVCVCPNLLVYWCTHIILNPVKQRDPIYVWTYMYSAFR